MSPLNDLTVDEIHAKIRRISELEEKYANQGVSFSMKGDATLSTTPDVLDHVLGVLEAVAADTNSDS